jgi:hypothetical protein
VLFKGVEKFAVTTPPVAVIDEITAGLGLKTAGAEKTPVADAAVRPPIASTPTILYEIF